MCVYGQGDQIKVTAINTVKNSEGFSLRGGNRNRDERSKLEETESTSFDDALNFEM